MQVIPYRKGGESDLVEKLAKSSGRVYGLAAKFENHVRIGLFNTNSQHLNYIGMWSQLKEK